MYFGSRRKRDSDRLLRASILIVNRLESAMNEAAASIAGAADHFSDLD
jgi:hypothetical protein